MRPESLAARRHNTWQYAYVCRRMCTGPLTLTSSALLALCSAARLESTFVGILGLTGARVAASGEPGKVASEAVGASRTSTTERVLTRKDDSTSHNVAAGVTADSHPPPVVNSPITTNPTEPTVHLTRFRVYASPVHTLSHHVRFAPLQRSRVSVHHL